MRYRNCRTFSASGRVWHLEQSSEIPIIHTEGENCWCFSVSIPLINDLKHQGFEAFFRSKFHLNNYVQEENKRKKVYKQTCLALELERIPQYAPKITRKKNTHMCVWTHMNFFRHQLSHAFVWGFRGSQKMLQNQMRLQQRDSHFWNTVFLEWYIHFLNQDAFHPQDLLGGVSGGGRKGRAKKSKGSEDFSSTHLVWLTEWYFCYHVHWYIFLCKLDQEKNTGIRII